MKTRSLLGIVALALVVGASAFLLRPKGAPAQNDPPLQTSSPSPPVLTPEPEPVQTTINLSGQIQSGAQASLSARMPARIAAVPVRQGESVRRGQLLVQLADAELQSQVKTAQAGEAAARALLRKAQAGQEAQRIKADNDIASAQAGLRQAKTKRDQATLAYHAAQEDYRNEKRLAQEGIKKAEVGLARASETLRGLEELARVGGVSKNDLEGARAQVTVAQSDLEMAQTQARRLEAADPAAGESGYRAALARKDREAAQGGVEQAQDALRTAREAKRTLLAVAAQDVRAAEAALEQARAGLSAARTTQNEARLLSPMDGVAASVSARVGETAQPGMPLVTVVSLTGLRAEALVTARQLARLRVGQAATIRLDTHPGRKFAAEISDIARAAEPDGRTFRITFRFRNPVSLRPGQNARITVMVR